MGGLASLGTPPSRGKREALLLTGALQRYGGHDSTLGVGGRSFVFCQGRRQRERAGAEKPTGRKHSDTNYPITAAVPGERCIAAGSPGQQPHPRMPGCHTLPSCFTL